MFCVRHAWDGNNVQTVDDDIPSYLVRPNHHISRGHGHKWWVWKQVHNLNGKYSLKPHDFKSRQQPKVKSR